MFVCSVDRMSPRRSVYWSQLRLSKSEFTQFYDPDHLFASGSYSLSLGPANVCQDYQGVFFIMLFRPEEYLLFSAIQEIWRL